jgi:hypothetical protein
VNLRVFVREHELEVSKSPNPLTMVTLRGSTGSQPLTKSPTANETESAVTQEMRQGEEMESLVYKIPYSNQWYEPVS